MKRLLRNNHSSGSNNRGGNPVPQDAPQHSRIPPRQATEPPDNLHRKMESSTNTTTRVQRGVSVPDARATMNGGDDSVVLPTAWLIDNTALLHSDPRCIVTNTVAKTTVSSNRPIPKAMLQQSEPGRGKWRRRSNDPASYSSYADSENHLVQVYYFEITVVSSDPSASVEVAIGLSCNPDVFAYMSGEVHNTIGWGTDGLHVNGRHLETNKAKIHFRSGDVLGCGIELGGMQQQRVFFTRNGTMIIPPNPKTSLPISKEIPCFPVASFRHGQGDILKANFGIEASKPLVWTGTERLSIVMAQPGRSNHRYNSSSIDSTSAYAPVDSPYRSTSATAGRSRSPSPYYSMTDVANLDDPTFSGREALSRSMGNISSPRGRYGHAHGHNNSLGPGMDSSGHASSRANYFGTRNHRKSLVDEDPSDVNQTTTEHFNLPLSSSTNASTPPSMVSMQSWQSGAQPRSATLSGPARRSRRVRTVDPVSNTSLNRGESEPMSHHRIASSGSGSSPNSPSRGQQPTSSLGVRFPEPRSSTGSHQFTAAQRKDDEEDGRERRLLPRSASVAVAAGNEVRIAKENSQALVQASKRQEIDGKLVREMLENCKRDQEKLQLKLNNALEEADAIENLEELFAVNDGICSAIDIANEALKREKQRVKKKKKSMEGPTIDLLVENQDVFSLICMLRAPTEKRFSAALALMKFARENELLRNEIRSSGGMHSFLTLYRTKGTAAELQVVACMAVAYVLPSFVVSSQTSSSIGLKIVECLRFLVKSKPVTVDGTIISRNEMVKASSVGVNVLWINAIQPLLAVESAKAESNQSRPVLMPSASMRFGRSRGNSGGGMFDQGQESTEIRELAESAVTLITHVAKLSDFNGEKIEIGYNIVEQVCEVDAARPIAVREGLLTILVEWIRSKEVEKVRPAASALRYLISIKDKYMAGWIHSQVVNEGAVGEIVKLLNESVGHDVRVAVAQMLSALCVAPHTRAAVVEARCVSYLVALLYEHSTPSSEEMVRYAASALLQLAAGAMTRATTLSGNLLSLDGTASEKQETVITEIIEGWAHGSFVQIALEHKGRLRSVSVEALRVLSEDTNKARKTRLQLCNAGAAEALGKALKDDVAYIKPLKNPEQFGSIYSDPESALHSAVKDVHESLCGLANILEPTKESSKAHQDRRINDGMMPNPRDALNKGCLDVVKSGGLDCLIWISNLPYTRLPLSENPLVLYADRTDLLDEACRLMANLSPLLLTDHAAAEGCSTWASHIFEALHGILIRVDEKDEAKFENGVEVNINALRGLGALARYEPLKIRIVDKTLPKLLSLKTLGGEKNDLSNYASQVLLSLGFTEDEITVQVAGNDPKVLVDWFCLQRALLLQAMARAELRSKLIEMWQLPFSDLDSHNTMKLIRETSIQSNLSHSSEDKSVESEEHSLMQGLFENYTNDGESHENRASILQQYHDVYMRDTAKRTPIESSSRVLMELGQHVNQNEASLMAPHTFPLNDTAVERDWILSHHRAIESQSQLFRDPDTCPVGLMPERIEKLLDCCFPSRLLRNGVVPFNDFRPQSSFNFRALMMPQRRYFSFRREGQLLTRLCERQAALSDTDELHWSLGFTNSTFAGEFVESLVQTLYLCPMITGLSFSRNADWLSMRDAENENDSDEGVGLLSTLAGSLPPWITFLTFENVLSDRDLKALVAIIDTMGKLSTSNKNEMMDFATMPAGQTQGKFTFLAIRNSPHISRDSWNSLFNMLGNTGSAKRGRNSMPLSSLTILDLSGNKLGDELTAKILELVHDKDSGCNLEQLDLSGNRIGRGTNMVRVLQSYTEYYRYDQKMGVKMVRSGWKSSLHTLILGDNDLFLGQAGLEIFALLKHNALCLRFLDLSNNGLEGDTYQILASSLLKNTSLCHLNLSGNKFSSPLIDLILEHVNAPDADSGLSFLMLENNSPQLNPNQRYKLGQFLRKSRKNTIERFINGREKGLNGSTADMSEGTDRADGLELIDEVSTNIFRSSFSSRRRLLSPEIEASLEEEDEGDNMITVLFSAPLVFADEENTLHPFAKLDFDMERELLWQCMKEASRDIEVSFDNAHHSRLLATMTKRCTCLHYSGHGHPHFLPFEDGMGGPNWLNVQDIEELLLRDGAAPFKFVFVSACHSGLAGETFASAGVPHVVCCQQEQELKDTAALAFTRSFYLALAVGHTVKEAFEQGCKAVRATPNLKNAEKEMEKFVLLPKNGNHDVPVFRAKPVREWPKQPRNQQLASARSKRRGSLLRGKSLRTVMALGAKSSELSTRNMMQEDPSPTAPQFFIGREVDMYYILTALLKMKKRLVNVLGEPGIGRSSLICALCHYINERASTITEIDHMYFIKPKHGGRNASCRSLLRQLLDMLEEDRKCRPTDEDSDTEAMLDIISRSLKNDKALIVFDRTELLEKSDDAQELPMILSTLLYDTKHVKVILTGKHPLGQPSIGGQVEHPYNLGPLNFANSVRLFANLCPHLHTPSERVYFFTELINECNNCSQLFPGHRQMSERSRAVLSMVGDGVPAKIEKAAYSISKEELNKLQGGR